MFEQRILCHQLPNSFDLMTTNDNEEQCGNERKKMAQGAKRQMLHTQLELYELKIQHYDHLYEQTLAVFQAEINKTKSFYQMSESNMLMHFIKIYVYHHTKLMLRRIRYKESRLHVKLLRHQHRRQSLPANKTIDVYPRIIVDVPNVSLNHHQLDYLSRTGQLHWIVEFYIDCLCYCYSNSFRTRLYQTKSELSSFF